MDRKKKYAVFTMDVEDFTDTECVSNAGVQIAQDMLDGLDEYIRLLEKYGIKATMFTICRTAQQVKEKLLQYIERGHRIALHGYQHVAPLLMDDERFRRETAEAKQLLEQEFRTEVRGYRAPCFSMDSNKLNILQKLGFRYDSSRLDFEPARHTGKIDVSSFREVLNGVFCKNGFFEFGLACQKVFGQKFPVSGGGYVRLSHWSFIMPIIQRYLKQNDYYVFYLHPFEMSKVRPPAIRNLKMYDRYYLKCGLKTYRLKVEAIIKMLIAYGYTFVTFDELADLIQQEPVYSAAL